MAGSVDLEISTEKGPIDYDPLIEGDELGHIHCRSFIMGADAPVTAKGKPKGHREYEGITITKALDKSSPTLIQLFVNRTGLKASFKIVQPNVASSDVAHDVAQTITIGGDDFSAWIRTYKLIVPDVEARAKDDPAEAYELITFTFTAIRFEKSGMGNDNKTHAVITEDDLRKMDVS